MDSTYTPTYEYDYNTDYNFEMTPLQMSDPAADAAATAALGGFFLVTMIITLVITLIVVISMWRLFTKAGKPGWAAIVPIYNIIVMLEIAGKPLWWVIMFFLPIANVVFTILTYIDFAKAYGKDALWGVLLAFFTPIVAPIMAFSKNTQYVGAQAPVTQPVAEPVVQPPVQNNYN